MYGALRDVDGWQDRWRDTQPDAEFIAALEDDLNTPKALAALFALAKARAAKQAPRRRVRAAAKLRASAELMGLLGADPEEWFHVGRGGRARSDGDS